MLKLRGVESGYDLLQVLWQVDIEVGEGSTVANIYNLITDAGALVRSTKIVLKKASLTGKLATNAPVEWRMFKMDLLSNATSGMWMPNGTSGTLMMAFETYYTSNCS